MDGHGQVSFGIDQPGSQEKNHTEAQGKTWLEDLKQFRGTVFFSYSDVETCLPFDRHVIVASLSQKFIVRKLHYKNG